MTVMRYDWVEHELNSSRCAVFAFWYMQAEPSVMQSVEIVGKLTDDGMIRVILSCHVRLVESSANAPHLFGQLVF